MGSAIVRLLEREGYGTVICRDRADLDLRDQAAVAAFFRKERPDHVFLAAARVGGILANSSFPADFIYDNLMIQANVLEQSRLAGVERLLFLGSTCIYPRLAPQPLREEYLLTGPLEPTNEPYAVAKIAGLVACRAYNRQHGTRFLAAMPTNLYGPNDNFDLEKSHVLPALVRKVFEARAAGAPAVTVWGSGTPRREFLHVDDAAGAALFLMNLSDEAVTGLLDPAQSPGFVNVCSGEEITIADLAGLVREVAGYDGRLEFDLSRPDGTPRKLSDPSRLRALGWRPEVSLRDGVAATFRWYESQVAAGRGRP
jgi:GDP-L-fucose synthase